MKIRHRIKFAVDNMLLHASQMRFSIMMNFFTFLILGIMVLLYNTAGSFKKDVEDTMTIDISNVGYIYLPMGDYEDDMSYISALSTQDYIEYSGTIYTEALNLGDDVNEIQSNDKRDSDNAALNSNLYSELIEISQTLFGLYNIKFYHGYMNAEEILSNGYIPVYAGYKFKKIYDIGDTFALDNDTYMIAGFIKRNQSLPVDDLATIDKYCVNATTFLDRALIGVISDVSDYQTIYFGVKEGYNFDDVKYRLELLAERENVYDISIYNVGAVLEATDNSTKSIRRYLLELFVIVGLSACITLACYQSINILTRKYEYGVLYATGFNKTDMQWIIAIESAIKILIAIVIAVPIIAGAGKFFFEPAYASGIAFNRIIYRNVLGSTLLTGLIIMIVSTLFPVALINKNSPQQLMMDKIVALMLIAVIVFSGCGKEDISYETEIDDVGSVLETALAVPKSCTYEFTSVDDDIAVTLDTENIVLPDADELLNVYYEKNTYDSAYKKKIAEGIFDKEEGIYVFDIDNLPNDIFVKLEDYYNACIEIAESGGDTDASEVYKEFLLNVQERHESADEPEPAGEYAASEFIGYVDGVSYLLSFDIEDGGFEVSVYPEEFVGNMISAEDKTYASLSTSFGDAVEQDLINTDALNVAEMSGDDACDEAYDFLNALDITDIAQIEIATNEWVCYELLFGQEAPESVYDGYYITFTDVIGNATPYVGYYDLVMSLNMDGVYKGGKTVSTYEICLNDNGIISAVCHDKYIKSSVYTEQTDLLSWDEMLEAVSPYIEGYYADKDGYNNICFNYVYLTYYEMKTDDIYEIKPVWIFLAINDQSLTYDMTMYPEEMLIVDAATGEPVEID